MSYENILKNLKETPPRALNDHILIVDAMNMLIRSFSLLKAMNPTGTHIGGLEGPEIDRILIQIIKLKELHQE